MGDANMRRYYVKEATAAYEKYFGAAPSVDKGTAYAFVIYFPSSKEPGKVVPFPFFTFDEGSIKKVAVERLLGGLLRVVVTLEAHLHQLRFQARRIA